MKLLKFIPKGNTEKGSLIQAGTEGYTFGVEIEVQDNNSSTGTFNYSWGMPVYKDKGGEYIDFSNTALKGLLGKIYLGEIYGKK